jgi:hypothetical protein
VVAASAALHAPPEFTAVPLLALAGAAIGNAVVISPKPGWTEQANLYVAVVAPQGSKKTPALHDAARPVAAMQKRLTARYEAAQAEFDGALAAWEGRPKKERGPRPKPPVYPHVVTTDATVEALAPILAAGKGVALVRDELAGWIGDMNAYRNGRGSDRQHYLS